MKGLVTSYSMNELHWGASLGLYLLFFVILVFPHKVPASVIRSFMNPFVQILAIGVIFTLMYMFDPLIGLLGSIVFLFIWSINFRKVPEEKFVNYRPIISTNTIRSYVVPEEKRDDKWFIEKVMKEQPYIIEEDLIKTNSVQDNSDRSSMYSQVSR
jgi:hypothetical protein